MGLRILFATHAPPSPTAAVHRCTTILAEYLERQSHDVEIVTPHDLRACGSPRFHPFTLPPALARRGLSAYDVVVFHSYLGWAFHAARRWLDTRDRVTTITAFHGLEPLYHAATAREYEKTGLRVSARFRLLHHVALPHVLRASCRASDAVICLNSAEADYLATHSWALPERIFRVANGVEEACFMNRTHRPKARRLLFVGQWLPAKGIRYLVDAFSELAIRRDLELSCVGTGLSAERVLADFPAEHRVRVSVRPVVDRTELYDELGLADVFVFPTLSEGFSRALLEAMASQLPIVTTRVGAAIDILQPDQDALLISAGDAHGLARGIERLVDSVALREQLGAAAGRTAAGYTNEATSAAFAACVGDVVRRREIAHSRPDPAHDLAR